MVLVAPTSILPQRISLDQEEKLTYLGPRSTPVVSREGSLTLLSGPRTKGCRMTDCTTWVVEVGSLSLVSELYNRLMLSGCTFGRQVTLKRTNSLPHLTPKCERRRSLRLVVKVWVYQETEGFTPSSILPFLLDSTWVIVTRVHVLSPPRSV